MLYQRVAYIKPEGVNFVTPKSTGGGALGSGLFITPRDFTYNVQAGPGIYTLADQGLVALMAVDGSYCDGGFRIVTKSDWTMDVLPFMEAMAAICSYGTEDEGLSHNQRLVTAKNRPLEMRCGPTCDFVRISAASAGLEARTVHALNVTQPNGFDDGHVMVEARVNGVWKLFDVPNDRAWADGSGGFLSLAQVVVQRPATAVACPLAQPRVGRSPYPGATSWVSAFYEMQLRTQEPITAWCERIYEVPGIATAQGVSWGLPDHLSGYASYIANYPGTNGAWTTMPWSQWVATHYP